MVYSGPSLSAVPGSATSGRLNRLRAASTSTLAENDISSQSEDHLSDSDFIDDEDCRILVNPNEAIEKETAEGSAAKPAKRRIPPSSSVSNVNSSDEVTPSTIGKSCTVILSNYFGCCFLILFVCL